MIHLRTLHKRMLVKGIVADDVVEILDLRWHTTDQLTITCQDSNNRLHTITLSSAHESKLECVNAFVLPWELLPQSPGKEDMRTLTKAEKKLLNQSLARSGFKLQWNKEGGYSDWTQGDSTYRVFHTSPHQSFIMLLEAETAKLPQNKKQTVPQITHTTRSSDLLNPLTTIEEPVPSFNSDPASYLPSKFQFLSGMYIRIPFDLEELEDEYRDYQIGQIVEVNSVSNLTQVKLQRHSPGQPVVQEIVDRDLTCLNRCHILPETPFTHADTHLNGQVLLPCQEEWKEGQFCEYYVQIEGRIQRLSEEKILAASHRQAPHPIEQLKRHELHHPRWKFERDQLIESYAQLHTATFGLEDLVGSRIMLLPHQAEVVATALSNETCRYILADEVGLGKTIEACVILKGLSRRHPGLKTLIIAPASLVEQWHFELDSKFWLNFLMDNQLVHNQANLDG